MAEQPIQFNDGAAYERGMAVWSQLAGKIFLDWLAPRSGQQWIDVGCGNGAFTELIMQRCAPADVQAIDLSEAQLAFARTRPGAAGVTFGQGDASALPFEPDRFDAAVMALVLFFVPEPAKGLAEMTRVVRPGGTVAAYVWDLPGGGFPFEPILGELGAFGIAAPRPPSATISAMPALRALWQAGGLEMIESREITVRRTFNSFEDFWATSSTIVRSFIDKMDPGDLESLKAAARARMTTESGGQVSYQARANAIKGRRPIAP